MRRPWLALAVGAVAAAAPTGVARGQETAGWRLAWSAPAGCPDAAQVRQSIARLLGDTRPPDQGFSASAVVVRTASGWHAEIGSTRAGAGSTRSLDSDRCEDLADAAALVVALMINPSAIAASARSAPSPVASPPESPSPAASSPERASQDVPGAAPTAAPAESAPPVASPNRPRPTPPPAVEARPKPEGAAAPPRPARPTRFFLSLFGTAALGTLPGVAAGIGGSLGYRYDRLRLTLDGAYWPPEQATVPGHAPAGGSVDLATGGAEACAVLARSRRLEVGPCGAIEAGRMHATGEGVSAKGDGAGFWGAVAVGGYASFVVAAPVAATLEVGLVVPVASPKFELTAVGTAFQPAQPEGRTRFSVEVRF